MYYWEVDIMIWGGNIPDARIFYKCKGKFDYQKFFEYVANYFKSNQIEFDDLAIDHKDITTRNYYERCKPLELNEIIKQKRNWIARRRNYN